MLTEGLQGIQVAGLISAEAVGMNIWLKKAAPTRAALDSR
jgi:hypothetical protein